MLLHNHLAYPTHPLDYIIFEWSLIQILPGYKPNQLNLWYFLVNEESTFYGEVPQIERFSSVMGKTYPWDFSKHSIKNCIALHSIFLL